MEIKNAIFLNKAIRKLRSKKNADIIFKDISEGAKKDIYIEIRADATLANVAGAKSQIGTAATLKTEEKGTSERPAPIMRPSCKSQRVANAEFGSEIQAIYQAFGAGTLLRIIMSEITSGRARGKFPAKARNNNISSISSVNSTLPITQEKRLVALLERLREMLGQGEIEEVSGKKGKTDLAGGLSKANDGEKLHTLLTENIIV